MLVVAKPQLAEEPFALILPDDVDDKMLCLQQMVDRYDRVHRPIVAVESFPRAFPALTRNFGIAVLASEPILRPEDRLYELRGELQEKPANPIADAQAHRIVGRYIFTPELFAALTDNNLTAAINRAWVKSNGVCAYIVERPLASIAPLKDIIVGMDSKEIFRDAYYRQSK
jgi:UTP-glucose-1-phosphate uridylyltransferase